MQWQQYKAISISLIVLTIAISIIKKKKNDSSRKEEEEERKRKGGKTITTAGQSYERQRCQQINKIIKKKLKRVLKAIH